MPFPASRDLGPSVGSLRAALRASLPAALTAALAALLLAPAPPAHAQGGAIIWTFQGIEDINVAEEIADRDSDGVNDVVIETYDSGAPSGADHLYLVSGASVGTATVRWSKRPVGGVSSGGGDGDLCLAVAPDMTGDGEEDVLLGTAWGGRSAYVFDADTGRVVWKFDTYTDRPPDPPLSGWVYQVIPVPDRTGDGVSEVAFACGSDNNSGYLADGVTGGILWQYEFPDAAFTCTPIAGFTQDGDAAVVYGTGDNDGQLYCLFDPGPSGLAWQYDPGGTIWHCATIGDLTGDGVDDVVAATWAATVVALNGKTGGFLWSYSLGSFNNGMRVAILDDVNNDGYQDIAAACWDNAAQVVSGIDGTRIWLSRTGTYQGGDVWAIDRMGDVTGDGINDVVAGSFDESIWAFDGRTGDTLWVTPGGGRRIFTVRGTSDLTGNGFPDALAGTQMLSGVGGKAHLLEGGTPTAVGPAPFAFARTAEAGVVLSWEAKGPGVRADVWRAELAADERGAVRAKRAALLAARAKGALSDRDVARAIMAGEDLPFGKSSAERFVRVNAEPLDASVPGEYLDATVTTGARYAYRLVFTAPDGAETATPNAEVLFTGRGARPERLALYANAPNPFTDGTTIRWDLPASGRASLAIYNAAGERVRLLVDRDLPAGRHEARWDGRDDRGLAVGSGVYFYRLTAPRGGETRTLTLLR